MISKMTKLHMFLQVEMIKIFSHPANITPEYIPIVFTVVKHAKDMLCGFVMFLQKRQFTRVWEAKLDYAS